MESTKKIVSSANEILEAAALALAADGIQVQARNPRPEKVTFDLPPPVDTPDDERSRHNAAVDRKRALKKLAKLDRASYFDRDK